MKLLERAPKVNVADEVWIGVALLHTEHPNRSDFSVAEILDRIRSENIAGSWRPGLQTHITAHCVANKPPQPGNYRMLYETERGRRRLFREGDEVHPMRKGKITPEVEDIPYKYRHLLDWYQSRYAPRPRDSWLHGIFEMMKTEGPVWAGVDADAYVRELREGWE